MLGIPVGMMLCSWSASCVGGIGTTSAPGVLEALLGLHLMCSKRCWSKSQVSSLVITTAS